MPNPRSQHKPYIIYFDKQKNRHENDNPSK